MLLPLVNQAVTYVDWDLQVECLEPALFILLPLLAVPLIVTSNPSNLTVIVEERASFVCTFSGSPAPSSIHWFKEGVGLPLTDERFNIIISSDSFSSELSFEATPEENGTRYFCQGMQDLVTGEVTEDSESATLTIQSK